MPVNAPCLRISASIIKSLYHNDKVFSIACRKIFWVFLTFFRINPRRRNAYRLSIPKDISIISFNNSLFAKLTSPRLTSVDLNSFQLGIEAASQLISHVERPELMATKSIIPHRIVERESCRDL